MKLNQGNFKSNLLFLKKTGILNKKKRLLEIGSGSGYLLNHLRLKGFNVAGTEKDIRKIKFAKKKFHLNLKKADDACLCYRKEVFDVVLSFDVLEHIPNTDLHLQEVKRVLKPKGFYLLGTPNKITNIPFEMLRTKSFIKYKQYHCSLHNYWSIKKRFIKNGFNISFIKVPVFNSFFKNKLKKNLSPLNYKLISLLNPDKLPIFLRTNFYIVAQKNK